MTDDEYTPDPSAANHVYAVSVAADGRVTITRVSTGEQFVNATPNDVWAVIADWEAAEHAAEH